MDGSANLNGRPVRFVAVSSYVRDRLVANGVNAGQIGVIENFLSSARLNHSPRRPAFDRPGIRRLIVISRLDPRKTRRSAAGRAGEGSAIGSIRNSHFRYGLEWRTHLKRRAAAAHLNVVFEGFEPRVDQCLAHSDLLVHTLRRGTIWPGDYRSACGGYSCPGARFWRSRLACERRSLRIPFPRGRCRKSRGADFGMCPPWGLRG